MKEKVEGLEAKVKGPKQEFKFLFKGFFLLACVHVHLFCPLLFASPKAGTAGAQFLNLGVSARSIAMGNAYSAVSLGGAVSSNYNPAGLYGTLLPEISLMHYRYLLDSQFSYVGYAQPLGPRSRFVLAAHFIHGAYGSIQETYVNVGEESGSKTGSDFSASDNAGTLSFAAGLTNRLGLGVNLKYVSQVIAGVSAGVPAGDIGLNYRMGRKISFGLAARNIGPDLKFDKESVPLPLSYVLGLSYALLKSEMLLFTADVEKQRNQNMTVRFGGELNIGTRFISGWNNSPVFSLRAGHDGLKDAGNGIAFGAGMRMGNYSLDYAFIPFGQLGEAHRISAAIRFGKLKESKSAYPKKGPPPASHSGIQSRRK